MGHLVLRSVLGLLGVVIIALGLNIGFGGIPSLGWQGPTDFITVVAPDAYAVQDNHVRFLGGFWLGAGFMFLIGAVRPYPMRGILIALCAMIVIGGIARLSVLDTALLSSAEIAPSLIAEFMLFPLIAFWLFKAKQPASD